LHPVDALAPGWAVNVSERAAGVYVHIPFCDRICPYCDFAVVRTRASAIDRYCAALRLEIERAAVPAGGVATIYFGGGTPSALPSVQIASLLAQLREKFAIAPDSVECTLEANPSRGAA